jgi:hypothetical protein
MIFCAYKSQLELLASLYSFKVDMSYKRIQSKEMNKVIFTTFLLDQAKGKYLLSAFLLLSTNTL